MMIGGAKRTFFFFFVGWEKGYGVKLLIFFFILGTETFSILRVEYGLVWLCTWLLLRTPSQKAEQYSVRSRYHTLV